MGTVGDVLDWSGWAAVTLAAVFVGLVASVVFVVRYQVAVGWGWWRFPDGRPNHFGRYLMERKALLALLFCVVVMNRIGPDWWDRWREAVAALLMVGFALQTFVPYRLLLMAQEEQHAEEDKDHGLRNEPGDRRPQPGR